MASSSSDLVNEFPNRHHLEEGQTTFNLYHVLRDAAENSSGGIVTYAPGSSYSQRRADMKYSTYYDLFHEARNTKILLHFADHSQSIAWFWGTVLAGYVPAISPPLINDLEQRKKHLAHVNSLLEGPLILTTSALCSDFLDLEGLNIMTVESLKERRKVKNSSVRIASEKRPDDLAALMLTSGSTGNAKAVCLRHGQIIAALDGKSKFHKTTKDDVFFNWIGLDHVANLTEIHLHAMRLGAQQIHLQGSDLLVDPLSFVRLLHKHRVSYTFAPNFFLATLVRCLQEDETLPELDLSSLKALISGGEANVVETCSLLTKLLHRHHAISGFIRPGFGMTETCAGSIYGKSCPSYDIANNLEFASLGTCVPGMKMRVVSETGKEAELNEIGDLQVRGPIVFNEYFNNTDATYESFSNGWFITGDRAFIDSQGNLNLAGRAKESVIINGVKHSPQALEAAIEEAALPGVAPSYTVVFPHRPKGSPTETVCVVYNPCYDIDNTQGRTETHDAIASIAGMVFGARPHDIIPLEKSYLPKSSLGKLSRAKIRKAFEAGEYQSLQDANSEAIRSYRQLRLEKPSTLTEERILDVLCEHFGLPLEEVGVDTSLFHLGVTSLELIQFKTLVQQRLSLVEEIPLIVVLTNPTIQAMAAAIDRMAVAAPQPYDPVVILKPSGPKTPLWVVHPGVGEILVFLNLSKHITDRPVYALRARGFNPGEGFFSSISEIVSTYASHIKRMQPSGPYAIAGYSFGAMLAFEVSKLLEQQGDNIAFLGSFNLPPHIKTRMQQLDWIEVLLNLSYFLGFTSDTYATEISEEMHKHTDEEVLDHIMSITPPARLHELALDRVKLARWASLAHSMQAAAQDYEPSGSIASIDVFVAIPLAVAAASKEEWVRDHLSKWKDYSRSEPRFHDVAGEHYTMMGPEHVLGFQKTLKKALAERGL